MSGNLLVADIFNLLLAVAIGISIFYSSQNLINKGLQNAEHNWQKNTGFEPTETPQSLRRKSQMIALSVAVVSAAYFYIYVSFFIIMSIVTLLFILFFLAQAGLISLSD